MTPLAHLLDRIGWKPAELARQIGCSPDYAHKMAHGLRAPPPKLVAWLERRAASADADPPPQDWRRPRFGRAA